MEKQLKCKNWHHAIAAYRDIKGMCDTCLYRDDKICPFDKACKEVKS